MKVCTDACLFGAWVAQLPQVAHTKNIADIGTGTGLLSLMLAQKTNADITAIEIDECAAMQAAGNFSASPWGDRLNVIHKDLKNYSTAAPYDLVISNPPFFENDLQSPDNKRNMALHSSGLSSELLIDRAANLLSADGTLALLLPYQRLDVFVHLALEHGLYLHRLCNVRQTEKHSFFRSMVCFGRENNEAMNEELSIKFNGQYSETFTLLLKD